MVMLMKYFLASVIVLWHCHFGFGRGM